MGTVHAKAEQGQGDSGEMVSGGGLFEFEAADADSEPILPKPTIKLDGVRARVDRVHVEGLARTRDDLVRGAVDDLFHATHFQDVVLRAHRVRRALDALGCFRSVGVFIDVSHGPHATPEGLEVQDTRDTRDTRRCGARWTRWAASGRWACSSTCPTGRTPRPRGSRYKTHATHATHAGAARAGRAGLLPVGGRVHRRVPRAARHARGARGTRHTRHTRHTQVRRALDALGCFRSVGVFIDVSHGPHATPEGLEVTFQVKELSRIVGGVNTTVTENEGNLVLGVKLPNVFGRGEKIQSEYSMGYRSSSNFSVAATKPYPHKAWVPVLSASVYQQNHEYPWSGYRLLDRGLLLGVAFNTSPATKHQLQWEGLVRETAVLSKTTSFKIRESSGPQMKSVLRHIVSVDHRDEPIFPTRGTWVQFSSEVAGLGGGVAHVKTEMQAQANVELMENVVLQVTGAAGILHDVFGTELPDNFFLGGPTGVRGFRQRGLGPQQDGHALGGRMYWAGGAHVFLPLPFRPGGAGGGLVRRLGELSPAARSSNAGCLADPGQRGVSQLEALSLVRVSCGAGVALRLGRVARLELNYALPLVARKGDQPAPGLSFGVGGHFL
ncbi:sorting and assembly machinery component 50 homolog [Choristoneura fumiferana]|uniref:sorting and assembly machinery component 50 homolog n=1 Tax=Choristoneura fumiferana TaxID=7141 RepID=UPI003D1594CD